MQEATRQDYYHYQPVGQVRGFIWSYGPAGVKPVLGGIEIGYYGIATPALTQKAPPGGIFGDQLPPNAPRVLCLARYQCGSYVGCIGFVAMRKAEKAAPALKSSDPCKQCMNNYFAGIDSCRANIPVSTNDQYNGCIFKANQVKNNCVAKCRDSGPLKAGICAANDPSLEPWNRRFVARMQQEWVQQTSQLSRQQFPTGFQCTAKYTVSKASDSQQILMSVNSISCYPAGYETQLRSFLYNFPGNEVPFPGRIMAGTEVVKEATFRWGYDPGLTRGTFADSTVQVKWPTPAQ